jgi:hypothetical protein
VFEEFLEIISRELPAAGIPYMVIGGQAVQVYGEPRMTRDIDVTLGLGVEGLDRVLALCRSAGLRVLVADPAQFSGETMVLPAVDESSGIRVDFVLSFSEYERQALGRSREVEVGGQPVRFVSLEDLLIHKLVAGRPRDIEDVRLVLVKNPGWDRAYVERWLAELDRALALDLQARLRDLLHRLPPAGS